MVKILKNGKVITFLLILVVGFLVFIFFPKPIDMSIEKVGNGTPAVVFIYDLNLAASNRQASEINKAQQTLGGSINFLIANAGDPTRADFREKHNAQSADLLFFDGSGKLIDRSIAVMTAEEFIAKLAK